MGTKEERARLNSDWDRLCGPLAAGEVLLGSAMAACENLNKGSPDRRPQRQSRPRVGSYWESGQREPRPEPGLRPRDTAPLFGRIQRANTLVRSPQKLGQPRALDGGYAQQRRVHFRLQLCGARLRLIALALARNAESRTGRKLL